MSEEKRPCTDVQYSREVFAQSADKTLLSYVLHIGAKPIAKKKNSMGSELADMR